MEKTKLTNYGKIIILISTILIILTVGVGILFMAKSRDAIKQVVYDRMLSISDTTASMINGDVFATITEEDHDNNNANYKEIYDMLTAFLNNNDFVYIYVVRETEDKDEYGDPIFVYIVDPDPVAPAYYGEEVVHTEALVYASQGRHAVDNGAKEDRWGSFYSAYSPIYNSNDEIVGIVGIDFDSVDYERQLTRNNLYFIGLSALSLFVGALVAMLGAGRTIRRFRILNQEVTKLSEDVDKLTEDIKDNPDYKAIARRREPLIVNDDAEAINEQIYQLRAEIRQYIDYAHSQAYMDSMTGVGNKTAYLDLVQNINKKIVEGTANFSVVVFDLNGLKVINDNKGHVSGDQFIINSSKAIIKTFGVDKCFRIGGDEFIVVLENVNKVLLQAKLNQLPQEVKNINTNKSQEDEEVSFSYGSATFNKDTDKIFNEVFKRADDEMYAYKARYYLQHGDRRNK